MHEEGRWRKLDGSLMRLTRGHRLGPYEILQAIGAGGMGEVYSARDTRLGREVAVKISAERFSERFEREARSVAAVNHPNVCTLFDVGPDYLVMELVEGPTLAERIEQGPVPLRETLAIAGQIAAGLEAAHERGIVHRDLKPANIKLKSDGSVKVLDFGLSTSVGLAAAAGVEGSPTMTVGPTQAGAILGTAAYMPPEQARGLPVDKRADIWAFGCVIYQMLSGRPPFEGQSIADVLAAVMTTEPDWAALPAGSPVRMLQRCLEKDPKLRLRDIGDADLAPVAPARSAKPDRRIVIALVALLLTSTGTALVLGFRSRNRAEVATRLVIPLAPGEEVSSYPAISQDGRTIAYAAKPVSGEPQLYLRQLNSFDARAVPGSLGAQHPFFSPDGRSIGFLAHGAIFRASVSGGSPVKVADSADMFGATWNADDTIIFPASFSSGLLRVPASGGTPEPLTSPDGAGAGLAHTFPQALPDGRHVIFTMHGKSSNGTALLDLGSKQWRLSVPRHVGAVYGATGRILAANDNAEVRGAAFDPASPTQPAPERLLLENVFFEPYAIRPWLATSASGTLVYAPGNPGKMSLVWVDREGRAQTASFGQGQYRDAALSPDGSKALVNHGPELWIHDFKRGTQSRLTFPGSFATSPAWSPDGKTVLFASDSGGDFDIYSQPADGSRSAELLLKRPYSQYPSSVGPDGTVAFAEAHPVTGEDLWLLSPDGKTTPYRVSRFFDSNLSFSPDGRWLAYDSDESGRREVYVESYPARTAKVAVSSAGGTSPVWSRDSRELFYCSPDSLMAVALQPDGSFGAPQRLFDQSPYRFEFRTYGTTDGKRFLMIRRDAGSVPRQLNVVLNWFEELPRSWK
jgi:Tol biopolymer transport system component